MINTINAIYKNGRIIFDSDIAIPDETKVFVSYFENGNDDFYLNSSEYSLDKIWANEEDDIYEELLKK